MATRARLATLALVAALVAGNVAAARAASIGAPPLPVLTSLIAPAAGATTVPATAALRVPLDTTSPAWTAISDQFGQGRFGLRVSVASTAAQWYVGPDVTVRPGMKVGSATYDPATATVTAEPSMPLGAVVSVTLAVEDSLQTLLTSDDLATGPSLRHRRLHRRRPPRSPGPSAPPPPKWCRPSRPRPLQAPP